MAKETTDAQKKTASKTATKKVATKATATKKVEVAPAEKVTKTTAKKTTKPATEVPAKKEPAKAVKKTTAKATKTTTKTTTKAATTKTAETKTATKKVAAKTTTKTTAKKETKVATEKVVSAAKKNILYISTEVQPFIATGGLADVAGSLPKFVTKVAGDIDMRVVLPLYQDIDKKYRENMQFLGYTFVKLNWRSQYCGVFSLKLDGVTYYFIDNEYYFKRKGTYGYLDDGERFAFFSKAVLDMVSITKFVPNIIHANDWQSALTVIYLKTIYNNNDNYRNTKALFTIHNIEYQGVYGRELLGDIFDLPAHLLHVVEYDSCINLVKGAIVCSDMFSTVSPSYAQEIKTEEYAKGLHHIIRQNAHKLTGILNGIDYDFYNPKTDKALCTNYDFDTIDNKVKNKLYLQKQLGLQPLQGMPVVAIISRLVSHKGLDLVKDVIQQALQQNRIQFIVVGPGDESYVNFFKWLESKYPGKVKAIVGKYENVLARQTYAACDIFLMPSKFEPCGLSQMIASRFGAIPIVRETGGLRDSIKDFGCEGGGNGYTFRDYNASDLLYNINRAVQEYYQPETWKKHQQTVMNIDFSWQKSAKEYVELYNKLV